MKDSVCGEKIGITKLAITSGTWCKAMTDATERNEWAMEKAEKIIPDAFILHDPHLRLTLENIKRDIEAALLEARDQGIEEACETIHLLYPIKEAGLLGNIRSLKSKGAGK